MSKAATRLSVRVPRRDEQVVGYGGTYGGKKAEQTGLDSAKTDGRNARRCYGRSHPVSIDLLATGVTVAADD